MTVGHEYGLILATCNLSAATDLHVTVTLQMLPMARRVGVCHNIVTAVEPAFYASQHDDMENDTLCVLW